MSISVILYMVGFVIVGLVVATAAVLSHLKHKGEVDDRTGVILVTIVGGSCF